MTEPKTVQALVIQPDGTFEYRTLPTGYPTFVESFLGQGYLECLYPTSEIVFWFDEEGGPMFKNLDRNYLATNLFHALGDLRLQHGDVVCGPVAITGRYREEMRDCPPEVTSVFNEVLKGVGL